MFKELEDELIHFTHARHVTRKEQVDESHHAKQTNKYLDSLVEAGVKGVTDCYRTLCDVTHPGIGSVRCYADVYRTKTSAGYRLRQDPDADLIADFCKQSQDISRRIAHLSILPPVMTLLILNEFGVKEIKTLGLVELGLTTHPAWKPFATRLADVSPPESRPLDLGTDK
jgi:hypothetical protein